MPEPARKNIYNSRNFNGLAAQLALYIPDVSTIVEILTV